MANLIENWGYGLGLQSGGIKDYASLYAQGMHRRDAQQAAQQKSDDAAYDKFSNKIKIDGVHRLYQDESEKDLSSTMDQAFQVWNDPARKYDRKNSMGKIVGQFVERQKGRQAASKKLDDFEKQYQVESLKGNTTPLQDQIYQKVRSGNWEDLAKTSAAGDEVGSVHFDPNTKGMAVTFRPDIDIRKAQETYLKDPSLQTAQESFTKGVTMKGGTQRYTMSYIPRTPQESAELSASTGIPNIPNLQDINDNLMANDKYARGITYDMQHTIVPVSQQGNIDASKRSEGMNQLNYGSYSYYDKPFSQLSPSQKAEVVHRSAYDILLKGAGAKIKEKDDNPFGSEGKGYNAGSGSGSNQRFNTAPFTGDREGHDLTYIGTDPSSKPKSIWHAKYALRGDATESGSAALDRNWPGKIDGVLKGNVALTHPLTGKKQMFLIIEKASETAGSSTEKTGDKTTEHTKEKTPIETYLIPADGNESQAFDYAGDKKGNNPFKLAFEEDMKAVKKYNSKAKGDKAASSGFDYSKIKM